MGVISWLRGLFFNTPSVKIQKGKRRIFSYQNGELANNETIFAAITILSNAIATAPISLKKGYEKVPPRDHSLAKLCRDGPNPNDTMFIFIRLMEVLRNLKGKSYAIKEYDYYGNILNIWVLDSDSVSKYIIPETKELWYAIKSERGIDYIHSSHIIEVSHISADGMYGISPIKVLRNTLQYEKEVKEFSLEQLNNSINIKYAFKINGNLNPQKIKEYNELIQKYIEKGVIYLDSGKELKELQEKNFIDTKVFEVEKITTAKVAKVFNLPPHKLSSESQLPTSAEQGDLEFLVNTILPIVRMYEQEFNKKCLSEIERDEGYEIKFNLNGFARGDMKTRGDFYQKMIRSAGLTPNEMRNLEDLPPKPGGDDLFVSRDLIAIKDLPLLIGNNQGSNILTKKGGEDGG